jgi:hypothetical protein
MHKVAVFGYFSVHLFETFLVFINHYFLFFIYFIIVTKDHRYRDIGTGLLLLF